MISSMVECKMFGFFFLLLVSFRNVKCFPYSSHTLNPVDNMYEFMISHYTETNVVAIVKDKVNNIDD